ncbi:MAG: hypothetical protein OXU22_08090, partial [Gammaproteobacteria bacterium]|nr:hypothetical protein [Gammaproteobacteria bacterium]
LNEADEMFWVSLNLDNNGAGEVFVPGMDAPVIAGGAWGEAVFAVSSQGYTIVDNDLITLAVTATAAIVTEGRSVQFDVTLDSGSDGDIDVLYTLGGLDGVTPNDLGGGGRLRINRGQTAGAITAFIPPTDVLGASSDSQTLTLDITGVERLPTESVLQRTVGSGGIVSIVETEDRAAGAFNVSSTQGRASVAVDWVDGEHVFELSRAPAVVTEGGGAATAAAETWFVTRTAGRDLQGGRLRFSWIAFPTGANGAEFADFTGRVGDLVFRDAPGIATSQSFRVGIAADGANEATETFIVVFAFAAGDIEAAEVVGGVASLPGPREAAIADSPADAVVVGITRDTGTPEGVAEGGEAVFTVALSGGERSADVVVPFVFSGAGITAADFRFVSPDTIVADTSGGVLVFYTGNLGGRTREEIRVRLLDDDLNEGDETLTLSGAPGLRTAGAIRYATTATTVSIIDDARIAVSIGVAGVEADPVAAGPQVREGGAAAFTVFLDRAGATTATIPYLVGGDVEPEDYGGGATGTVMVPAGRTTAALVIPVLRDGDIDAVETMTVSLAESGYSAAGDIGRTAGGSTATSVQITHLAARTLRLVRTDAGGAAVTTSTVVESDRGVAVHYRIGFETDSQCVSTDTGVLWAVRHGDPSSATAAATADADFAATTGTVVIAAGTTDPAAFTLTIRGDDTTNPPSISACRVPSPIPMPTGKRGLAAAASCSPSRTTTRSSSRCRAAAVSPRVRLRRRCCTWISAPNWAAISRR